MNRKLLLELADDIERIRERMSVIKADSSTAVIALRLRLAFDALTTAQSHLEASYRERQRL